MVVAVHMATDVPVRSITILPVRREAETLELDRQQVEADIFP